MGNWKIEPNGNIDNGLASFSNVTAVTEYTITYTDDNGCETTKKVKARPKETICDCSEIVFENLGDTEVPSSRCNVTVSFTAECGSVSASTTPNVDKVVADETSKTVTFTIGENTSVNDRTYDCYIKIDDRCPFNFRITQNGAEIEPDEECGCKDIKIGAIPNVENTGGTISVPYTVNCSMVLTVVVNDENKYLVSDPTLNDDSTISFNFTENDSANNRSINGYVGFKDDNDKDIKCSNFTITQYGKQDELNTECDCNSANLTVKADKYVIPYDDTGGVSVTYSYDCDVENDDASITYGDINGIELTKEGKGKVTVKVPNNDGMESRQFWCKVKITLKNTAKTVCEKTVFITQNAQEQIEEICEFDDFTLKMVDKNNIFIDSDGGSNTTGTTFTLKCSGTGFTEICTIEHCGCPKTDTELPPVRVNCTPLNGWLEVSANTETVGSECHTKIYVRTKDKNNTGEDLWGSIRIGIEDSYGMHKEDKWNIPIVCVFDENVCPKDELGPCDDAVCGEIYLDVFGPFAPEGGMLEIAKVTFMHPNCTDLESLLCTTTSDDITIGGITNNIIYARLPDLSECSDTEVTENTNFYDLTLSYKLNDKSCESYFTISQYRNTYPCGCECDDSILFTVNTTERQMEKVLNSELFSYDDSRCGYILDVVSTTISNINIDRDKKIVYGDFPDFTECGHDFSVMSHIVDVQYAIDSSTQCTKQFSINQKANDEDCCNCETGVTFTTVNRLPQNPGSGGVTILEYKEECGEIITATCDSSEMSIVSKEDGKIKAIMPDLSGCGHPSSEITYKLTVKYEAGSNVCSQVFDVKQEANTESCCVCDRLSLSPAKGATIEVSYEEQKAFTIKEEAGCPLTVVASESWITVNKVSDSEYDINVPEYTGTTERNGSISVKDENGSECTVYHLTQLNKEIVFLKEFDYMTFIYRWSSSAGSDLDTVTMVKGSGISGLDNNGVGYGCSNSSFVGNYLKFGGDNTSNGTESVCLFLSKMIDDIPPETEKITIELYAGWCGDKGNGNVSIEYYTFKGGTMSSPTSAGNLFTNNGGQSVDNDVKSTVVSLKSSSCSCMTDKMLIGEISYNAITGVTLFKVY